MGWLFIFFPWLDRPYTHNNTPTAPQVNCLLEEVAQRLASGQLRGVRVVPASDAAAGEAAFLGVPITSLEASQRLHFYFDTADELTADGALTFVVGQHQQPTQEGLGLGRAVGVTCILRSAS